MNVWDGPRSLSSNTMCTLVVHEDKGVCLCLCVCVGHQWLTEWLQSIYTHCVSIFVSVCVCNSLPSTSVGQLAILAFKP